MDRTQYLQIDGIFSLTLSQASSGVSVGIGGRVGCGAGERTELRTRFGIGMEVVI